MALKTDENGNVILKEGHGKKDNQKLKPYLVMQYLLHNSDESHAVRVSKIIQYLKGIGIYAERRSIYSDIEQINIAMLMAEKDLFIEEAYEELKEYGDSNQPTRTTLLLQSSARAHTGRTAASMNTGTRSNDSIRIIPIIGLFCLSIKLSLTL